MKKFVLSVAMVASLLCGGLFTNTAQAHGPHYPPRYSYGYGAYTGYGPYNNYRAPFPPYGPGYMGGCQPYRGYRQPHFGLYLGF
jgi:hypothetical protein